MTLLATINRRMKASWAVGVLLVLVFCSYAQAPQTIHLTVNYNDGIEKRFTLPFKQGMTVFDAMTEATATQHGLAFACDPKYPCNGSPNNGFLTSIDDVKGQGSSKYWALFVNDIYADKGFGTCKLHPNDEVVWKFGSTNETAGTVTVCG